MSQRKAGSLYSDACIQRAVGGLLVTEVTYPESLTIRRHDHELASICVVLAGGYDESFGQRCRRAEPGSVIVHPEGEHHANSHEAVVTRLLNIEIGAAQLRDPQLGARCLSDAWDRRDFAIAAVASRICLELTATGADSELMIESLVLELLALLDKSVRADSAASAWLLRVRDALEAHSAQIPSMKELSELAGVHTVHLSRTFKHHFGCTIGHYVRRIRVGRTLTRLQNSAIGLTDVALEAGFSDQSHMNRCVVEQTGLTPGAWRRRQL